MPGAYGYEIYNRRGYKPRFLFQNKNMEGAMNDLVTPARLENGLTYEAYREYWKAELALSQAGMDRDSRKRFFYKKYNLERSEAVHQAYRVSEGLRAQVASINAPQYWMVLTETWCADSAYCIPVIAEAAGLNSNIQLRLLLRDENLDVMDQFLTNGGRAIPKLVAFDADGAVLFTWGSRPAGAIRLRDELKAAGAEPQAITRAVVDWYDQGGWNEVDAELAEALVCVDELC